MTSFLLAAISLSMLAATPAEVRAQRRDGLRSYELPFQLCLPEGVRRRVEVEVAADGHVLKARAVPVRNGWLESTAFSWVFEPSRDGKASRRTLTFLFDTHDGVGPTSSWKPIHSRYQSPLTLHLWFRKPEIRRFTRMDGRLPQKRCPIHHELMFMVLVPWVATGFPQPDHPTPLDLEFRKVCEQSPYYAEYMPSGDVILQATVSEAYTCASCRRARMKWLAAHPDYMP